MAAHALVNLVGEVVKAVILAGGLGTRISEETSHRPKPMISIGGKPILWHIMKMYSTHGVNEFIICCGYMGYVIKEYFANYFLHMSDVTFDMAGNSMEIHQQHVEPWRVTLVDTGDTTQTGGRLRRVARFLNEDDAFCFTYGDGVSDIDITAEIAFHYSHGKAATVAAVSPPGRFGALEIDQDRVSAFVEKPLGDGGFINGGFFVLNSSVIELIDDDACIWEDRPIRTLIEHDQLRAFRHEGFWRPMDTLRDKIFLEELWQSGNPPWKTW